MSWGYKILLAYSLFMLMIFYFLFVAFQQKNEMIEENYYEKEIVFQSKLDAESKLLAADLKPTLEISQQSLNITLPEALVSEHTSGVYSFIRLSDKTKDITGEFQSLNNGTIKLNAEKFIPGIYLLTIQWNHNHQTYLHKEQFNFNKP